MLRSALAFALLALLLAPPPARAGFASEMGKKVLRLVQTGDGGDVRITHHGGGEFGISEGGGGASLAGVAPNLVVVMQGGSGSELELVFDEPLPGGVTLELGSGERQTLIAGDSPALGGDFVIRGGTSGLQQVAVTASQPLEVAGDLLLENVNAFSSPSVPVVVGGDLRATTLAETAEAFLELFYLDLEGDFVYRGGGDVDFIELGFGEVEIRGKVAIDLGDSVSAKPYFQVVRLRSGMNGSPRVVGRTSVRGGDEGNAELVDVESGTEFVQGLRVALGDGENAVELGGTSAGFRYKGGAGVDSVALHLAAPSAKLKLGAGDDTLQLASPLALGTLAADFGPGTDSYEIEAGTDLPGEEKLKNLP